MTLADALMRSLPSFVPVRRFVACRVPVEFDLTCFIYLSGLCALAVAPETESEASETCFFWHSDMLHSAPLCVGIAHDPEDNTPFHNVYWAFDGMNGASLGFSLVGFRLVGCRVEVLSGTVICCTLRHCVWASLMSQRATAPSRMSTGLSMACIVRF